MPALFSVAQRMHMKSWVGPENKANRKHWTLLLGRGCRTNNIAKRSKPSCTLSHDSGESYRYMQ